MGSDLDGQRLAVADTEDELLAAVAARLGRRSLIRDYPVARSAAGRVAGP